jgi:hypothetical protein
MTNDRYGKIHTDGSRSGGQPLGDSIQAKARDMVRKEDNHGLLNFDAAIAALCRAIEQHEAFKQEVSDAAEAFIRGDVIWQTFGRFIIPKPKPDPLAQTLGDFDGTLWEPEDVARFRAALEARGLKIVEKGQ